MGKIFIMLAFAGGVALLMFGANEMNSGTPRDGVMAALLGLSLVVGAGIGAGRAWE